MIALPLPLLLLACPEKPGEDTDTGELPLPDCSLDLRHHRADGSGIDVSDCEAVTATVGATGERPAGLELAIALESDCTLTLVLDQACEAGLYTNKRGLEARVEGGSCTASSLGVGSAHLETFALNTDATGTPWMSLQASVMLGMDDRSWITAELSMHQEITADVREVDCQAPGVQFQQVDAGDNHTCGLDTIGGAHCWGTNQFAQSDAPEGTFTDIRAGMMNTCAMAADGMLTCWGSDGFDQVSETLETPVKSFEVGGQHICVIDATDQMSCWGWDEFGQCQAPDTPYTTVTAGLRQTCALTETSLVDCWGDAAAIANTPASTSFSQINANYQHACGLTMQQELACWGEDEFGQSSPPTGTWLEVASAERFSCALDTQGQIHCWGTNTVGQTESPPGTFQALTGGSSHACALDANGAIHCWGPDSYGQCSPP